MFWIILSVLCLLGIFSHNQYIAGTGIAGIITFTIISIGSIIVGIEKYPQLKREREWLVHHKKSKEYEESILTFNLDLEEIKLKKKMKFYNWFTHYMFISKNIDLIQRIDL